MTEHVSIAGAGLAGSLLALYMARRGIKVDVFERRGDMRRQNVAAGRSINLAISTRGIHALREVGVDEAVMQAAIPMRGRMLHDVDGKLTYQPYSDNPNEYINSLSRATLNRVLLEKSTASELVDIHFDKSLSGVSRRNRSFFVTDENTQATEEINQLPLIGTDGAFSGVRYEMLKQVGFNYSQTYLDHSYKELTIPPGPGGSFQLEKEALHIWPRGGYMLIALPNLDGSFTCTLFLRTRGKQNVPSFASLHSEAAVTNFLETNFSDAVALMPNYRSEFFENPTASLVTVRCAPWHSGGDLFVMGDAAHAIVPFFGQGMNAAFEDVYVFDKVVGEYGPDWSRVFEECSARRKPDADAIADMALDNFIEMRDQVADQRFLFEKAVERELQSRFQKDYLSRYSLVTFRRYPYAFAQRCGQIQGQILAELTENKQSLEDIDWQQAGSLIEGRLAPLMRQVQEV